MNEALVLLYKRDLERLKAEIEAFNEDSNLWRLEGEIKNTAGNLGSASRWQHSTLYWACIRRFRL